MKHPHRKVELSLGQHLQNWFIRNNMDVTHPLFVASVDHTIANAIRDSKETPIPKALDATLDGRI